METLDTDVKAQKEMNLKIKKGLDEEEDKDADLKLQLDKWNQTFMKKYAEFNEQLEETEWMDEQIKTVEDRQQILVKLLTRAKSRNDKLFKLIPAVPKEAPKPVEPVKQPEEKVPAPAGRSGTEGPPPVSKKAEDGTQKLMASLGASLICLIVIYVWTKDKK